MSEMPDPDALRLQILSALEPASDGQDLSVIHLLLNRSRRDTSMLPVRGALVSGGYLEKVAQLAVSSANAPIGSRPRRAGPPAPIRFRLTDAGRLLLKDERAHAPAPVRVAPRVDERDETDETDETDEDSVAESRRDTHDSYAE